MFMVLLFFCLRYPSVFDWHITHRLGCLTCPKHDMQIHAVHEHILTQVVSSRQTLHVSSFFGSGSVLFLGFLYLFRISAEMIRFAYIFVSILISSAFRSLEYLFIPFFLHIWCSCTIVFLMSVVIFMAYCTVSYLFIPFHVHLVDGGRW